MIFPVTDKEMPKSFWILAPEFCIPTEISIRISDFLGVN